MSGETRFRTNGTADPTEARGKLAELHAARKTVCAAAFPDRAQKVCAKEFVYAVLCDMALKRLKNIIKQS
jgi:hypothetical protein